MPRGDRRLPRIHQGKAARAVSVLRRARLEAGMAEKGGLLVARAARDGDLRAEKLLPRYAEETRARDDAGQDGRGYLEELEQLLVPSPRLDVEQQGPAAFVGSVRCSPVSL